MKKFIQFIRVLNVLLLMLITGSMIYDVRCMFAGIQKIYEISLIRIFVTDVGILMFLCISSWFFYHKNILHSVRKDQRNMVP